MNDGTADVTIVNELRPGRQITRLIGDEREEKQNGKTRKHEPSAASQVP